MILLLSCTNNDEDLEEINAGDFSGVLSLPSDLYDYANPNLPDHFLTNQVRNIDNTPNDNLVTDAGAT